ncbi:hypothetical protein LMG27198_36890 [Methylocystis echinoides]|uniref:Uncharacterized protein n=2 Tax=Methylocystis echinoides TaxID=29468 RepID=A0A9W6GX86_9HYPH|nr:hypothetical protein LMG27198_36890 [Methylocystis echinoides]
MDVLQRTSRRCVAVPAPMRQQALGTWLEGKAAIVAAFAVLAPVAARVDIFMQLFLCQRDHSAAVRHLRTSNNIIAAARAAVLQLLRILSARYSSFEEAGQWRPI